VFLCLLFSFFSVNDGVTLPDYAAAQPRRP
jgi:hypothetical protein